MISLPVGRRDPGSLLVRFLSSGRTEGVRGSRRQLRPGLTLSDGVKRGHRNSSADAHTPIPPPFNPPP
ncbi:unnamed protein product [Lota lota]